MAGASRCLLEEMATFTKKWEELYLLTITQQSKWFKSNHELGEGDIVFIRDMKTERGTPRLARIVRVDLDSQGTDRYYDCQYQVRDGGNYKVVRRTAQSLCLLLTANETKENADVTHDSISFPTEIPTQGRRPRPHVSVQIGNMAPVMDDV